MNIYLVRGRGEGRLAACSQSTAGLLAALRPLQRGVAERKRRHIGGNGKRKGGYDYGGVAIHCGTDCRTEKRKGGLPDDLTWERS